MGVVIISEKEYRRLLEKAQLMECLECAGVDNWIGWQSWMDDDDYNEEEDKEYINNKIAENLLGTGGTTQEHSPLIGKYVIVRTYSAGVFAGTFDRRLGDKIILKDCRRLWRWRTVNDGISLSEVAQYGICHDDSKICCIEPMKEVSDIEISICSDVAKQSILEAVAYVNK